MKKTTIFIAIAAVLLIVIFVQSKPKTGTPEAPVGENENPTMDSGTTMETPTTPTKTNSNLSITKIQVGENETYPEKAFLSGVQTKETKGLLVVQKNTATYNIQLNPQKNRVITPLDSTVFGVAVNGEPITVDALQFWNDDPTTMWTYTQAAHIPTDLFNMVEKTKHSPIVGYAADGFPIYLYYGFVDEKNIFSGIKEIRSGYQLKSNLRPANSPSGTYDGTYTQDYQYLTGVGAVDTCNSRFGPTPEYPGGTNYYVLTKTFPVVPHCFVGTPDPSFSSAVQ